MSTAILGISAFYHDSAAALIQDGRIVAAAQEERFTRIKHDQGFPSQAVRYCLEEAGLKAADLDHVVFYEKPLTKFERLLETYVAFAPRGFRQFLMGMPLWLRQKLHLPREMDKALGKKHGGRYVFCEHHESHAASAFFPSPFEEAAILTFDGVGEWATACYGVGQGNRIDLSHELRFPHSLGLLYSAFTYFAGFKVNSGEYKLMGLAPYGEPTYYDLIMERLVDVKRDGSLRLNMSYFSYAHGTTMTGRKFAGLFGGPPRQPDGPITKRELDMAASVQKVTEEIILRAARHVHCETGLKRLVLAGGVALNCVANGRILREGPFEDLWIQPAAGDAGAALGCALFTWYQLLGNDRSCGSQDGQQASLLGPEYSDGEIRAILDAAGARYEVYDDDQLLNETARLIAEHKVVGWFQGRMEFGPRALGNRSILGDARSESMQSIMNRKIKFRESFRPFAPAVLREELTSYFDLPAGRDSPYMLLVGPVTEARRNPADREMESLEGLAKLGVARSDIPAVTHVDYSARVQTVDPDRNPRFHALISRFKERTGSAVIVNTSFNIRGEPIVCSPGDAYRCFLATDMDALVLGNQLLYKDRQERVDRDQINSYRESFSPD
jgi:carbamoyltransferase